MEKNNKRSPIKEEDLLPLPGGYLRDRSDKLLNEGLLPVLAAAVLAAGLAILEWAFFLLNVPRHPLLMTGIAAIMCFGAYFYFQRRKKELLNYWLGYKGEVRVGQLLEGLRAKGFVPIHDVPCESNGKRFNIDHILIGPKGVFAVETKTWRKGQNEDINYENGSLRVGANLRDDGAIMQVKRNAEWVRGMLSGRMGEKILIHSLLLLPGWFVQPLATAAVEKEHGVLMLNPKVLGKFFDSFPDTLSQEQIQRLVLVISEYVHKEVDQQIE